MIFDHPWLLTLLIFAALVPWLAWQSRAPIDGMRKILVVTLQCSAIALLALALSGPLIPGTPPTTRVAIIAHGPNAQAASLEGARQEIANWREATPYSDPFHRLTAQASPDLAHSLRHALALIPSGHPGEIALFTDQTHVGPPLAPLLAEITQQAAQLHLRKIPAATTQTAITTVRHPNSAQEQETFRVVVSVSTAAAETARIEIHEGSTLLATEAVSLSTGRSDHSIEITPRGTGLVELETRLAIADAVDPQTGIERTALLIEGRTRVGHISADEARFEALRVTLARRGIELVKGTDKVDALIVDDLPASSWDSKEQEKVRDAVLHGGMGLMLAGAQSNLGPGGYTTSPLAEILPVEMPQHEERRDPSLSLVIIIDTSGSMGGNRVELAKEVARLAIRRLLPHDKVGIVEFYGSKRWAAPIQPASNTIEITRALNRLQAGGGTVIYSALEEAYYATLNARTRFKHILVLTDGGVESAPFEQLARQMANAGQNLTTVLIGPQSNSPFLMNLANWGRGRFYACPSRFQLPDLRFKEPQSSLLPGVHRRNFPLDLGQRVEAIGALEGEPLPATSGLVEARLRPGARLLVAAGDQRPLLADWDQGRGRVQIYASELLGPMADALRAHPPYASFLADDLRALSRGSQATRPRLIMTAYETHLDVQIKHVSGPTWPTPTLRTANLAVAMTPTERGSYCCRVEWPTSEKLEVTVETDGARLRGGARRPLSRKARAPIAPELDLLAVTGTADGELPTVPVKLPLISQNGVLFVGAPSTAVVPIARSLALAALIAFLLSLLVRRWPARSPSRQVVTAALPLLLALPLTAAQQDPIQQRIHEELREKGHLGDLEKIWGESSPEKKFAIARARGDLEGALAWLPEEGQENDKLRALLQDATGHHNEAIATLDRLLANDDAPTHLRTPWFQHRAELHLATHNREAAKEDFRQAVKAAQNPGYARRLGHLVAGYGLLDLALAWHLPTGSDLKTDLTIHLRRALWQERREAIDSAMEEYDKAFAVATKRRDRQFVLSRTASLMRRAGRLSKLTDRWLAKADKLPSQLHALLSLLREQGRGEEALELLEHTTDPALQRLALEVAVESNQSELAFDLAQKQLTHRPDDQGLRIALALILTDQRKTEEASKLLSAGIADASRTKNIIGLTRAAMELSLDAAIEHGLRKLRAEEAEKDRLEALILEANHLLQRTGKAAAIKVIDTYLSSFETPVSTVRIAELFESMGEIGRAMEFFKKAWSQTETEDIGLRLAWMLSNSTESKDRDEANQIFRRIWLQAGSEARRVQVEERVLDLSARDGTLADLAVDLEDELAGPEPEHAEAKRQALVKIYTRARDSIAASLILDEFGKHPGKQIQALQDKTRMFWECEEFRNHDRTLRALIDADPENEIDYRQQLAMSALERGRPADARQVINEMIERSGDDAPPAVAYEFSAGIFTLAGRHGDAIRVYRRTLAQNPDRIETLLLLANTMRDHQQLEQAIGMFCDILLQDNKDDLFIVAVDGLLNLNAPARTLRFAERALRRRIADKPDKVYLTRVLQDCLEILKDEEARTHSMEQTILAAGEQRTTFARELMDEASSKRDWTNYVDRGRDLLALGEEVPPAAFLELGEAFLELDDLKSAERAFSRARFAIDFAKVEERVADLYEAKGKISDAERIRRRILRRNPNDIAGQLAVARLAEQRGAKDEALSLYLGAAASILAKESIPVAPSKKAARATPGRAPALPMKILSSFAGKAVRLTSANREQKEDPSLALAVDGALRVATTAGQLQPLIDLLVAKAETPGAAAPTRLTMIRQLHRLATALDDQRLGSQLLAFEEGLFAAKDATEDIRRSILGRRVAAGELTGAAKLLDQSGEKHPFAQESFELSLLLDDFKGAQASLKSASPASLVTAAKKAWLWGATDLARSLHARFASAAQGDEKISDSALIELSAMLGVPVDEQALSLSKLERALVHEDARRRVSGVLAALRGGSFEAERIASSLRRILPDVIADKTGNLIPSFLDAAMDAMPAKDLEPLAETLFKTMSRASMLPSRVRYLRLLPEERQGTVIHEALGKLSDQERRSSILRLLAAELPANAQAKLIEELSVSDLTPIDKHPFTVLCLTAKLPRVHGEVLFAKIRDQLPQDPRGWVFGARMADGEEAAGRRAKAFRLMSAKNNFDIFDQRTIDQLVPLMSAAELRTHAAGLGEKTISHLRLRATLKRADGDTDGAIEDYMAAFRKNPQDRALFMQASILLRELGRNEQLLALMETYIENTPRIFVYQAAQMAILLLEQGQADKALDILLRSEDSYGSFLGLRLRLITAIEDPQRRAREARAYLQERRRLQDRLNSSISIRTQLGRTATESKDAPALALGPLPMKSPAPGTPDEAFNGDHEFDLLAFFPEGEDIGRSYLRMLGATDRERFLSLYRGILGASGDGAAELARAIAILAEQPFDAEALRIALAASQLGMEVDDAIINRAIGRRLISHHADLSAQAELLMLAHARGNKALVERILTALMSNRNRLASYALQTWIPSVVAIAATQSPNRLLQMAPGKQFPNYNLDGWILIAMQGKADPQLVIDGWTSVGTSFSDERRAFGREQLALPWCGWCLRAGRLDEALAALDALPPPNIARGSNPLFPPQAIGAAVPKLSEWGDRSHVDRLKQVLLDAADGAGDGKAWIAFRMATILAIRMAEDGRKEEAEALLEALGERRGGSASAQRWLDSAR